MKKIIIALTVLSALNFSTIHAQNYIDRQQGVVVEKTSSINKPYINDFSAYRNEKNVPKFDSFIPKKHNFQVMREINHTNESIIWLKFPMIQPRNITTFSNIKSKESLVSLLTYLNKNNYHATFLLSKEDLKNVEYIQLILNNNQDIGLQINSHENFYDYIEEINSMDKYLQLFFTYNPRVITLKNMEVDSLAEFREAVSTLERDKDTTFITIYPWHIEKKYNLQSLEKIHANDIMNYQVNEDTVNIFEYTIKNINATKYPVQSVEDVFNEVKIFEEINQQRIENTDLINL